jgi:spore germination cell wall hydrolase CwlJ-like protein
VSGATHKDVSDLDLVTICLLGEARCQSDDDYEGMRAIASVIQTRSKQRSKPIASIIMQKRQFSCLNNQTPSQAVLTDLMSESEAATNAAKCFAYAILSGWDVMPGFTANHYYAHDKCSPYWSKKGLDVVRIQDHTFLRLN